MGIPIYSERGPYGGFSLVRGYKMPPLIFTPEEAVSVYLGTSLVGEVWGQEYLTAEPQTQPRVQIRLHFAPEAALVALDDSAFWETLEEQPDGSVVVTFVAADLEWPVRVALGYGPHAVVLEPEELRHLVAERARAIATQYASTE